jgi:hypothetical protein
MNLRHAAIERRDELAKLANHLRRGHRHRCPPWRTSRRDTFHTSPH